MPIDAIRFVGARDRFLWHSLDILRNHLLIRIHLEFRAAMLFCFGTANFDHPDGRLLKMDRQ